MNSAQPISAPRKGEAAPVVFFHSMQPEEDGSASLRHLVRLEESPRAPGDRLLFAQRSLQRVLRVAEGMESSLLSPAMEGISIELGDIIPVIELILIETKSSLDQVRDATAKLAALQRAAEGDAP